MSPGSEDEHSATAQEFLSLGFIQGRMVEQSKALERIEEKLDASLKQDQAVRVLQAQMTWLQGAVAVLAITVIAIIIYGPHGAAAHALGGAAKLAGS